MTGELLDRALIEEASKKSGLIWVEGPGVPARPLWHVWHEGAACVIGDGPGEQPPDGTRRRGAGRGDGAQQGQGRPGW